jgi:Uma2 family endonuclease
VTTTTLVSLSEYLSTTYRPDRDFLEGELLERNMGEQPHSRLQGFFVYVFRRNRDEWGLRALPEQRVQVRSERFRIPDISVIPLTDPGDLILRKPPLICIEIFSSADTMAEIQKRVNDYVAMGVENVWAIDPWKRLGYYASTRGFQQPEDGVLRVSGTTITISLAEAFAELDEA